MQALATHQDPRLTEAYSTHTFFYPFIVKNLTFFARIENNPRWSREREDDSDMDAMDDYMSMQYFNQQVQNIFYGTSDADTQISERCQIFAYQADALENLRYLIDIGGDAAPYELPITGIHLFLFGDPSDHDHKHVAVLTLETYNVSYQSIQHVKRINDYGRRLSLPFIARKKGEPDPDGIIICADELGILIRMPADSDEDKCDKTWVTNFRSQMRNFQAKEFLNPPAFLLGLLSGNIEKPAVHQDSRWDEWKSLIQPVADDRMYLLSLIKDNALSAAIQHIDEAIHADASCSRAARELQEEIYALAFADPTSATCQNARMRAKLLEQACYTRWSDCGTLYTVTGNAFLCLTGNGDIVDSVYRPFFTEYYLMTVFVLAQKVSIQIFADVAARRAGGAEKQGLIPQDQIVKIIGLHEWFVSWYNQMYLLEVTEQEQGVDIYQLLREQFGIFRHMKSLRGQLDSLYAIANVNQGTRLSHLAAAFAIIAVFVDISLNLCNYFDFGTLGASTIFENVTIVWLIGAVVITGALCYGAFQYIKYMR